VVVEDPDPVRRLDGATGTWSPPAELVLQSGAWHLYCVFITNFLRFYSLATSMAPSTGPAPTHTGATAVFCRLPAAEGWR